MKKETNLQNGRSNWKAGSTSHPLESGSKKGIIAKWVVWLIMIIILLLLSACTSSTKSKGSEDPIQIAEEAYTYGLPIVLVDITRLQMLNKMSVMPPPLGPGGMNEFMHATIFPDHNYTDIVRPNVDTFYSTAYLDLSGGPIELSLPNTDGRFFMMQLMDAYTNVFGAPGTRTTGNTGGKYIIAGPGYDGFAHYRSSTNIVWILGRTLVQDEEDGEVNVKPLMQQYTLTRQTPGAPLFEEYDSNIDMELNSNDIVRNMPIEDFFNYLNWLMINNPPPDADIPLLNRMETIGIAPGVTFDLSIFSQNEQEEMRNISARIFDKLRVTYSQILAPVNGWSSTASEGMGNYGIDYLFRAAIAVFGIGANCPEDATYFFCSVDENTAPLTGTKNYILRFEEEPPIHPDAFWSLTLYEGDYLSYNELGRYALGDRCGLKKNEDGSIEIYLQHTNPGNEKESNWLPAPVGNFNLTLRAYMPNQEVLDGQWTLSSVKVIN